MKKIIILSAAIFIFSLAASAKNNHNHGNLTGVSSNANQSVGLGLSNAIAITFVSTGNATGSELSLPFSTVADYTNGVTSSAQQLKVQSNMPFNITVNANAANFTYSGSVTPAPAMPVTDLNIMVTANSTGGAVQGTYNSSFTDLSTSAATILSGCARGGNQTFSVQYEATPGFAYPAGTYTANVVYTATQP